MRSAATKRTTTRTGPIEESPTPDLCTHSPSRSPTRPPSRTCESADTTDSAASSTSANMPPDLHGRGFRHPQVGDAVQDVDAAGGVPDGPLADLVGGERGHHRGD